MERTAPNKLTQLAKTNVIFIGQFECEELDNDIRPMGETPH
ncbi:hypothetical protein CWATWH0003_3301 [Crocosphaera watsonii WH 0003]|uniref:Uncharacterized protein n=1 Tax=Crocosphaera watsonii WH 0003 TaxID=423471 RepID=G5J760_CROWT|nr:hypothetical protein CWATWH0003_3301 [Crocosphaera watsonii WH 0003]